MQKFLQARMGANNYSSLQVVITASLQALLSGNFFLEDGWRDNSPSKVNQVFGKAEWRNEISTVRLIYAVCRQQAHW